ncbi:phage holin family protein [Solibaculum intestinale]|uniref:Phage holin family protein n=1 Tax=Solibaculum intestinale TaxID=3133165 RepID=A0ABV1E396_9FIRM
MDMIENIQSFIRPELLVLVPVLLILGAILKRAQAVPDKFIPAILGLAGILIAGLSVFANSPLATAGDWLTAVLTAFVQGVLCAGAAVYVNQIYKQKNKSE